MPKNKKLKKTNEERLLDQNNISYEEKNYNWISDRQNALQKAINDGINPKCILKTIVLQANNDPKDYLVVCLSVELSLNLKKIAHELGKKQVHLANNSNLINITGYIHGANTPIGIYKYKGFPIYFDENLKDYEKIIISAGKLGRSIMLYQRDLIKFVNGKYIHI